MGLGDQAGGNVTTPAVTAAPTPAADDTPILVYAGGLSVCAANTAEGVANVLATAVDRRCSGKYSSSALATVTAPKALKLGRSVIDEHGTPLLHVFELDYKGLLRSVTNEAGPPPSPGVVRSSVLALRATGMFVTALWRPAKSKMAKFQLAYALLALCALIAAAAVAMVAGLVASGVPLPDPIESLFSEGATATLVVFGGLAVISWTGTRRWLLAVAATTQDTLRYIDNVDRHRDSVSLTIDDALDGLRDNGWTGPIHLLGYSMGSLVVFDACFPCAGSRRAPLAEVASIVTIGCPLDAVRLFRPHYVDNRAGDEDAPKWTNVYQATDVLGSNLANENDVDPTARSATCVEHLPVRSIRYLGTELGVLSSLAMNGFRTHSGYWSGPKDGNCFNELLPVWLPDLPYRS
jgi:hypothetical protein